MSIDYWSICQPLRAVQAKAIAADLMTRQRCGAIVGPDEETFVEAWIGVQQVDLAALAREYRGSRPAEAYWEGASVSLSESHLEVLERIVMTNRTSALSALDRVFAIPLGINLLGGHAVAHITNANLAMHESELRRLLEEMGGVETATRLLQSSLYGNGNDECAAELIRLLEDGYRQARREKLDLLLVSAVPP